LYRLLFISILDMVELILVLNMGEIFASAHLESINQSMFVTYQRRNLS